MEYESIDQVVQIISQFASPFLAKTDIASAFRMIPIHPTDCPLLGFRWRWASYVDLALPMGCASSSQIFQNVSDALVWMAQTHFNAGPIVSVLDDFHFRRRIFFGLSSVTGRFSGSMPQAACPPSAGQNCSTLSVAMLPRRRVRCPQQRAPSSAG